MIYFTADTHFYHKNIIRLQNRPYKDVDEMNKSLIANWNRVVAKANDEIYVLGDFALTGGEQANELLKQLNGKKYLIIGNHDYFLKDEQFNKPLFQWIKDYHVFKYHKKKFILFHYPIAEWESKDHGSVHLYGHIHGPNREGRQKIIALLQNAFNVGVDVCNYEPVSMEKILLRLQVEEQRSVEQL